MIHEATRRHHFVLAGYATLKPDVFPDGQVIDEIPGLHEHADVPPADGGAYVLRPATETKTRDVDMTSVRLVQASDQVEERRLSAARGTEKSDEFAFAQRELTPRRAATSASPEW